MILRRGIYSQYLESGTTLVPGDGTTNWVNMVGMTGTLGKIVPSSGSSGWGNHGGNFGTVPAFTDFTLSFDMVWRSGTTTGAMMIGISHVNGGSSYTDIDHCFYFTNQGGSVYETYFYSNGVNTGGALGANSWTTSSLCEIKLVGTNVEFYIDSVLVKTQTHSHTGTWVFDCSTFLNLGAENIKIQY